MDNTTMLSFEEVERIKAEVEKAAKRVEKSAIDVAEAQKRVSEMETGLKSLARSDSREKDYKNLLQEAKRESERRQKERHMALSEL